MRPTVTFRIQATGSKRKVRAAAPSGQRKSSRSAGGTPVDWVALLTEQPGGAPVLINSGSPGLLVAILSEPDAMGNDCEVEWDDYPNAGRVPTKLAQLSRRN